MDFPPTSTGSTPKPRPEIRSRLDRAGSARRASIVGVVALLIAHGAFAADPKLLPAEQAFRFAARAVDERTVEARFDISDGYYLYRDKLRFVVVGSAQPASVALPPGKLKEDPFFGRVETYRGAVVVRLPLTSPIASPVVVKAESQGCADLGVCYPPNVQQVSVPASAGDGKGGAFVYANPPRGRWFD